MIFKEIYPKTILSPSKVYPYVVNPYVGCQFGCSYCYARYMKRFTGHREAWGQFVDIKVNSPDLLRQEISRKKPGKVWLSGVCDPYQPVEKKFQLTRRCLEILAENNWPVVVQTKSPLALRDLEIFKKGKDFEVGFSLATANEKIRRLFEPVAPSIEERIKALQKLHQAGIRTYAMIAPLLPGAEYLPEMLSGRVDRVIIDRMNYHYADWVYRQYHLEEKMTADFFKHARRMIEEKLTKLGILT